MDPTGTSLLSGLEVGASLLALAVGILAHACHRRFRDPLTFHVAAGFLGAAMFDGLHAALELGVGPGGASAALADWSWTASRLFLSLQLGWAAWAGTRADDRGAGEPGRTGIVPPLLALAFLLVLLLAPLPEATWPGGPAARPGELLPGLLFLLGAAVLLHGGAWRRDPVAGGLALSLLLGFVGQAGFAALSATRADALFSAGAVLKQISYLALAAGLVWGLFRTPAREPGRVERRSRALFDAVPVGLYRTTPGGRILEANRELAELLGYEDPGALADQRLDELWVHPERRREWRERLERDGTVRDVELELRRRDGTTLTVLSSARVVRDPDGEVRYYEGAIEDIGERRRLQELLHRAQRMKMIGRLAGGLAHDLNNMLTVILGNCQMLLTELDASDPRAEEVSEIAEAGRRAASLTQQLLAYSRRQVLQPELIDLNAIVGSMEKTLRRLLPADIELQLELAEELDRVRADPGQVEQVIINLSVNAREAMPDGGRLVIATGQATLDETWGDRYTTVRPGSYVRLTIRDTGHGMDEATRERVFEPFFTTRDEHEHAGLGLSTTYGIVKQSNGYIWIDSDPGGGTVVNIYLPRAEAGPEEAATSAGEVPGTATVLVVEDQKSVRAVLARTLENEGFSVLTAHDGIDALEVCEEYDERIDLLVTDVKMPYLDGWQLAARLLRERPELRVLYISGFTDVGPGKPEELDVDRPFLRKPFTPEELLNKVHEVLQGDRER